MLVWILWSEGAARRTLPWIREYSPIELVTPDDPPIFLEYPRQAQPPQLGQPEPDPTHSAMYGVQLVDKLRATGVEGVLDFPSHEDVTYGSVEAFLKRKLKP
jgi:hypothetical protein